MILVCGGAGYIGSHMAKRLRKEGIDHVIFDNLERGNAPAVCDSKFEQGDLRNPQDIERVFSKYDIHLVMHFAAYIEVGESVKEPAKFWENNVTAVQNLLEACRSHGVQQFVFSSTAAVYGEPVEVPIPEDHPKNPTNPYGDTKLTVERMLASYDRAYGVRSICLRYFNACGSDPEGELGEDHRPETHLIPRILLAAAGKAPEITVFGTDYDTPDGTCIRDYVHVSDLADAHLRAVRYLENGGGSDQFNLGSGNGFSVRQVLDAVRNVTEVDFPVSYGDRREGDPARLVADSSKARAVLGWSPEFDDVEVCVRHAWDWMVAHPEGYEQR
jgi:UDP-glucose 4-epimerase